MPTFVQLTLAIMMIFVLLTGIGFLQTNTGKKMIQDTETRIMANIAMSLILFAIGIGFGTSINI